MSPHGDRREKVSTVEDAVSRIPSGCTLAVGGLGLFGPPMGLVREIVRQGIKDLSLVLAPGASIQADLLIGAGCVREVLCSYIGFEDLGLAPNFRRAAESGTIQVVEGDEALVVFGLKAGAARAPFLPLPPGMGGCEVSRVSPRYFSVRDPRTGGTHLCVAAINPEVAVIHAGQCDPYGNARHAGTRFTDLLMAKAATQAVIVSCDELIDVSATQRNPYLTSVPGFIVDAVVPLPYGCHPASSPDRYERDDEHLRLYLEQSGSAAGFGDYVEEFVLKVNQAEYVERIGRERLRALTAKGHRDGDVATLYDP